MRAVRPELADDPQHHRLGLRALELDLALAEIGLDAVELAEEVVIPEGAAELAVGDGLEPDLLLTLDDLGDLVILDRRELIGADLATLMLRPRLLQGGGPQQASDVIGAERRRGARHDCCCLCLLKSLAVILRRPRLRGPRRMTRREGAPAVPGARSWPSPFEAPRPKRP